MFLVDWPDLLDNFVKVGSNIFLTGNLALHPFVGFDLVDGEALAWILRGHFDDEVEEGGSGLDGTRFHVACGLGLEAVVIFVVTIEERKFPVRQHKEDNTAGENVYRRALIPVPSEHLGCHVLQGADLGDQDFLAGVELSQTEISHLQVTISIQEAVLELQVSVSQALRVDVSYGAHQLSE